MVWGVIKEDGTRIPVRCPDRMNFAAYEEVLKKGLLLMYNPRNIFQQDKAPCHKSKLGTTFLDKEKICVFSEWPAQSTDLNAIELL